MARGGSRQEGPLVQDSKIQGEGLGDGGAGRGCRRARVVGAFLAAAAPCCGCAQTRFIADLATVNFRLYEIHLNKKCPPKRR